MKRQWERPLRRTNPSGEVVWVARVTGRDGRRVVYRPDWNRGRGTFARRSDAQRAIEEFYERGRRPSSETVGSYFDRWRVKHPRAERTQRSYEHKLSRVLDVVLEGRRLRDWPYRELRRRHALELVDHLLRVQGRAKGGCVGILRVLSAMTEDAITDEVADVNFVRGVRVRSTDPRIRKEGRSPRVLSFEQMHAFAACARAVRSTCRRDGETVVREHAPVRNYEALVRTFGDTGMRLGEVLPLERSDLFAGECGEAWCRASGAHFHVTKTAHDGRVSRGTKTDHGESVAGRAAPLPPTLERMLRALPVRIDTPLLYPTPSGRLWMERNFYRDVWDPTRLLAGLDIRPHDCRHSFVSHLRAAGIDAADLAAMAGHTVETMTVHYTHALNRSFDAVREAIG